MEVLEIEVPPHQPGQFASPQPGWHVEKNHRPFPNSKRSEKQLHLQDFEDVGRTFSLGRDAYS